MPYTRREDGTLNNFPIEVEEQVIDPATQNRKTQYVVAAGVALVLVAGLCWVAISVS